MNYGKEAYEAYCRYMNQAQKLPEEPQTPWGKLYYVVQDAWNATAARIRELELQQPAKWAGEPNPARS